jgi:hypothetical protein
MDMPVAVPLGLQWRGTRKVRAIRNDMGKGGGGNPRELLVRDRFSRRPELRNNPRHVDGIPDEHRIGQQAEACRLVHDFGVIPRLKRPLIRKKEATRELVPPLATIELELHPSSERLIVYVA